VIVWGERDISEELRRRYPQHEVTVLPVTPHGASRVG
jgi:exonuclease VII large subunit